MSGMTGPSARAVLAAKPEPTRSPPAERRIAILASSGAYLTPSFYCANS